MSIESKWTIGAIASKKASASSPVSWRMASASAGEVSGPVATMTLSQSAGGRPATSPRSMVTSGCVGKRCGDGIGEAFAIDGERAAGGHLVEVAHPHDQRAGAAQLFVEEADGVGLAIVGAERVGADQLGETVGLVRLRAARPGASRGGPRGRRAARSARRPPSRRGRRR